MIYMYIYILQDRYACRSTNRRQSTRKRDQRDSTIEIHGDAKQGITGGVGGSGAMTIFPVVNLEMSPSDIPPPSKFHLNQMNIKRETSSIMEKFPAWLRKSKHVDSGDEGKESTVYLSSWIQSISVEWERSLREREEIKKRGFGENAMVIFFLSLSPLALFLSLTRSPRFFSRKFFTLDLKI